MERNKIYIGSYEFSWNQTTWKDWWFPITVLTLLAGGMLGALIYEIIRNIG